MARSILISNWESVSPRRLKIVIRCSDLPASASKEAWPDYDWLTHLFHRSRKSVWPVSLSLQAATATMTSGGEESVTSEWTLEAVGEYKCCVTVALDRAFDSDKLSHEVWHHFSIPEGSSRKGRVISESHHEVFAQVPAVILKTYVQFLSLRASCQPSDHDADLQSCYKSSAPLKIASICNEHLSIDTWHLLNFLHLV